MLGAEDDNIRPVNTKRSRLCSWQCPSTGLVYPILGNKLDYKQEKRAKYMMEMESTLTLILIALFPALNYDFFKWFEKIPFYSQTYITGNNKG